MYTYTAVCTDNGAYELSASLNKDGSYTDLALTHKFEDGDVDFIWDNQGWLIESFYKELKMYAADEGYVIEDIPEIPEEDILDILDLFKQAQVLELFI
jgi:hypothetical protein